MKTLKIKGHGVLIRSDAGLEIGTGHIMRDLALAQGLAASGFTVRFLSTGVSATLSKRLRGEGLSFRALQSAPGSAQDMMETTRLAAEEGISWLVLDGYHFSDVYQTAAKREGLKVLFIDDYGHARRYSADLVLNQNLGAREAFYRKRQSHTKLLLGPQYVLLRKEFWRWRGWSRVVQTPARRVLVTMGGSDPGNMTAKIMVSLPSVLDPDTQIRVVVGPANPRQGMLRELATRCGRRQQVKILNNVKDMAAEMTEADMIISAAGSTCWEMAFMGLPGLLLLVADNQELNSVDVVRRGMAKVLDIRREFDESHFLGLTSSLVHDSVLRQRLSTAGRRLVDGYGADRVTAAMKTATDL